MHLEVKAKDEEGNLLFEGKLNRGEVNFLIAYAVQGLMADGVRFNLEPQDEDEDTAPSRLEFPGGIN
jgi:hypothetical protein